ncbi:MAG TPA: N-acetyl-gamma-glutamyl-phosphate reductase [Bacillota bacterium]|nr:N-acetyl-gamma-glutamyl-phosphate reductase [Bacillota bacterium]
MLQVAILGATGYTGAELVRLLHRHPQVQIAYISSESHAGQPLNRVHPQFRDIVELKLQPLQVEEIPEAVELVFCALPHGSSAGVVPKLLQQGRRVIDLSADFRLRQPALYDQWYGRTHPAPELLKQAVYGLPELFAISIKTARLVANPGCYPTAAILSLAPLVQSGLADPESVIIDAKSGVSGAGRTPKQAFHFPDCTENFKAYRVGDHQHTPEIEQVLGDLSGEAAAITFTPHLVPMIRGIFSTAYLALRRPLNLEELLALYHDFYREKPFVRVIEAPDLPETRAVRGSNYCDISLRLDGRTGRVIVLSAIDNLVKGAAGQAVQNMNLMYGFPETAGLEQMAW